MEAIARRNAVERGRGIRDDTVVFQLDELDYITTMPQGMDWLGNAYQKFLKTYDGCTTNLIGSVPVIRMFGVTIDGLSVMVRVFGYEPHFFMRLSASERDVMKMAPRINSLAIEQEGRMNRYDSRFRRPSRSPTWKRRSKSEDESTSGSSSSSDDDDDDNDNVDDDDKSTTSDGETPILLQVETVESMVPLRGFHEKSEEFLFYKVTTRLPNHVPFVRRIVETQFGAKTYEADVVFVLRMMVDKDMRGCDWVRISNRGQKYALRYNVRRPLTNAEAAIPWSQRNWASMLNPWQRPRCFPGESRCDIEADVWHECVESLGVEGAQYTRHAPLRIMSFDIECAALGGGFPNPQKDPIITICMSTTHPEDSPLFGGGRKDDIVVALQLGSCLPPLTSPNDGRPLILHSFDQEADLLMAFRDYVIALDPDIITGYNILGFDLGYLWTRAQTLHIERMFGDLGRVQGEVMRYVKNGGTMRSRAYGTQERDKVIVVGRTIVDVMVIAKRELKLSSYSLNAVAQEVVKEQKFDVPPERILPLFRGSDADRREIYAYCVQDTVLPLKIIEHEKYDKGLIEMARATCVPMAWVYDRGQQIRVYSQVAHVAHRWKILIESGRRRDDNTATADESEDTGKYAGATVIKPIRGFHNFPVATLDFASLYPSIIIAYNICFITLLSVEQLASIPAELYDVSPVGFGFIKAPVRIPAAVLSEIVQQYPDFKYALDPNGAAYFEANSIVPGDVVKRVPEMHEGLEYHPLSDKFVKIDDRRRMGILPTIEMELLARRRAAKKLMAEATDSTTRGIYDQRQIKLKLCANSIYGTTGTQEGALKEKAVAASVTAWGREKIDITKKTVESQYCTSAGYSRGNTRILYGDSVSGDTTLIIRGADYCSIVNIEELVSHEEFWKPYPGRPGKVYCDLVGDTPIYVWSDIGFTPISRIIRHQYTGPFYRVITRTGMVHCTGDHSLVRANGTMVQPKELVLDDELLHMYNDKELLDVFRLRHMWRTSTRDAFAFGIFMAAGNCGWNRETETTSGYYWYIYHTDLVTLERIQPVFSFPTRICENIQGAGSGHMLVIHDCNSCKNVIESYYNRFYNLHEDKKVPKEFLHTDDLTSVYVFWQGFCLARGKDWLFDDLDLGAAKIGKQALTGLSFILRRLGMPELRFEPLADSVQLRVVLDRSTTTATTNKQIFILESYYVENCYVYDLETVNHHFHVGPGNLVVHNTDSVMPDLCIRAPLGTASAKIVANDISHRHPELTEASNALIASFASRVQHQQVVDASTADEIYARSVQDTAEFVLYSRQQLLDAAKIEYSVDDAARAVDMSQVLEAARTGKEACRLVTLVIARPPIELLFEKVFLPYLLDSKKRYAGHKYVEERGIMQDKGVAASGMQVVRRDVPMLTKLAMEQALKDLIVRRSLKEAIAGVRIVIENIRADRLSMYQYIITKSLARKYDDSSELARERPKQIHEHLAAKIALRQQIPGYAGTSQTLHAGDRVSYIIVCRGKNSKVRECGEDPVYAARKHIRPDPDYYVNKALTKPLNTVFRSVVRNLDDVFDLTVPIDCVINGKRPSGKTRVQMPPVKIKHVSGGAIFRFLTETGSRCVHCQAPLPTGQVLCSIVDNVHTVENAINLAVRYQTRFAQLGIAQNALLDKCRACTLGHADTIVHCSNDRCPTLYERIKQLDDIEDCSKSLVVVESLLASYPLTK